MRVGEIQLGDWFCYDGDVEYDSPVKIENIGINDECVTSDRDDVGFDGVIPIPLTDEILKLNGWKRKHAWTYNAGKLYVELRRDDFAVWVAAVEVLPYDDYADYVLPRPEYVHTLQHCLRLVGLNEMADNFKVK